MKTIKLYLDSLSYLIAVVAAIPLFPFLQSVPRAVFPAALLLGILMDRKGVRGRNILLTPASLAVFVLYALQANRTNFVVPVVNLLVVLLSIKILGEKERRDWWQISILSLFCLAAVSLFTLSPWFLFFFILLALLISLSMVLLTYRQAGHLQVPTAILRRGITSSVVMSASSLPLVLVFFFILPRTQVPLWSFLDRKQVKTAGFSDKISLGRSSAITTEPRVAFRVKTESLPPEQLYWRVIVLNTLEGTSWIRREPPPGENFLPGQGKLIRQVIYPQQEFAGYLPILNIPASAETLKTRSMPDGVFTTRRRGSDEVFSACSISGAVMDASLPSPAFYLGIPQDVSPRVRALGERMAAGGGSAADRIARLKSYFLSAGFSYANIGLPVGADPIDQFLYGTKKGNCEYFASSFALLLRLSGVPSRLVGGYFGGSYNEIGRYYVVSDSNAHVWVEAFVPKQGWITLDPTLYARGYHGGRRGSPDVVERFLFALDSISYYWNAAVINYDLDRQFAIISRFSPRSSETAPSRLNPVCLMYPVPPILLCFLMLIRKRNRRSVEQKFVDQYFETVQTVYGLRRQNQGVLELAVATGDPAAARFATIYARAIFHDRHLTAEEGRQLTLLLKQMRRGKSVPVGDEPSLSA